jgi:malonyl-CoA O-methyltransferase
MVWANMLLHHEAEPLTLMQRWNEALAIDGFLMFSTLGPGSLAALRDAYRTSGFGPAMAELVDMHDLGDLLLEAGFADPVMDQEIVRLTWARPEDALAELRSLGANAAPQRHAGLRTPRWQQRLLQSLAGAATTRGRIELEFEIVYGHAFKPEPRHALAPETRIGVDELRRSLQATRAHRP